MKKSLWHCLKSCYENSKKFHDDLLRSRRIGLSEAEPDPICPYCQVDHARVWDHLPSVDFPEFFVFPPNLIRVCGDCNSKKLATVGATRCFLNPFYDNLRSVRYLGCTVTRIGGGGRLAATFEIDPDVLNPEFNPYVEAIARALCSIGLGPQARSRVQPGLVHDNQLCETMAWKSYKPENSGVSCSASGGPSEWRSWRERSAFGATRCANCNGTYRLTSRRRARQGAECPPP